MLGERMTELPAAEDESVAGVEAFVLGLVTTGTAGTS